TRFSRDWSSDVCSSDLIHAPGAIGAANSHAALADGWKNRIGVGIVEKWLYGGRFAKLRDRIFVFVGMNGCRYHGAQQRDQRQNFFHRTVSPVIVWRAGAQTRASNAWFPAPIKRQE